jgi:glutathione synthase/RimK-type ligase-like ATP-grasp enzyme
VDSPYVGLLVNNGFFEGIPLGQTRFEDISLYEEAGQLYNLTPCYFRIQDVLLEDQLVHAYVKQDTQYVKLLLPLPSVIHNRAIHLDHDSFDTLQLWKEQGIQIFNHWNRYNKLYIHGLLMKDKDIRPHLPGTFPATTWNIATMMESYDSIIIKPNKSSVGRGVMKMDRSKRGWKLIYPKTLKISNSKWLKLRFRHKLPQLLIRRIKKLPYIVQQRLPLATYDERPFDLRVSVQRGGDGTWGVTGIVAKVAPPHLFLTNVAQGGQVKQLEELLTQFPELNPDEVRKGISNFAIKAAKRLSYELPHLADLGMDIGISKDGFPLFIECNGKDQRYTFREAGMLDCWRATYFNPIAYARYLYNGGVPVH